MKINRIALSLIILGLSTAIIFSCKKPSNEAPVADTETQSAVDASWALFAITDIEQMCAFGGENQLLQHFYREIPGSFNSANSTGSMTSTRDTNSKNVNIGFNKTWCYDGKFRDGTVFMRFPYNPVFDVFNTLPNATKNKANTNYKYMHDNGFVGRITFSAYQVDGWQIDIDGVKYPDGLIVANVMPEGYKAADGPIKWRIVGDLKFTSPGTDRSKDMKISVDLVKSLMNSNETSIYNQAVRGAYINWSNFSPPSTAAPTPSIASKAALVAYTGTISGVTTNGAKFRMIVTDQNPLVRDFTCYADKIGGVTVTTGTAGIVPRYNEFHPFTKGIASFTTGLDLAEIDYQGKSTIYPRQVYFGNEDDPNLQVQCDNTGFVLIKGIGYTVDFNNNFKK